MNHPIVPSILAANQSALDQALAAISEVTDRIHVDVMDGRFVPNRYGGLELLRELRSHTVRRLDCHLAISDPDRRAIHFVEAGADGVTVHLEAAARPARIAHQVHTAGAEVGLAVTPWTPLREALPHVADFDTLLLVTVVPGFGGQRMLEDAPARVEEACRLLRAEGVEIRVEVDGGVDLASIERCRDAGADSFVAGTAVFGADDPAAAMRALTRVAMSRGPEQATPPANDPV